MEVWEQQEGESDEAYVRFQYYMHLGPTRSLQAAYYWYLNSGEIESKEKGIVRATKSHKKPQVPGNWIDESKKYQWPFRANQWDIHNLSVAGRAVITDFYKMLAEITSQHLETIKEGHLIPRTYGEMLEGITLIGSLVSPEAVAAWHNLNTSDKSEEPAPKPENVSSIDAKRRAV
jgi:hypothetical protein